MSRLPIEPHDPRLTAYVLGELTQPEAAEVVQALETSPELRAVVDELRETTVELMAALQAESMPEMKVAVSRGITAPPDAAVADPLDAARTRSASGATAQPSKRLRGSWMMVNAVTLLLLVGVLIGLQNPATDGTPLSSHGSLVTADFSESRMLQEHHLFAGGKSFLGSQAHPSAASPLGGTSSNPAEFGDLETEGWQRPSQNMDSLVPLHKANRGIEAGSGVSDMVLYDRWFDLNPPVALRADPANAFGRDGLHQLPQRELSGAQPGSPPAADPVSRFWRMMPVKSPSTAESLHSYALQPQPNNPAPSGEVGSLDLLAILPGLEARPELEARFGSVRLAEQERLDAESYAPIIENEFIAPVGEAALSTFSLDVDTASYSNVRRFLSQGRLPPPNAVRLEELVNYFRYDLPQPSEGEPLSVTLEATSSPWNPRNRLVRIALQGREIDFAKRPLTRLVFLVDVSGSMSDTNKLPLVKQSLQLLVEKLGENDRIAIVTYADAAGLKLDSTPGDQRETILQAIESLNAEGSTNGAGGIQLAYEIAAKHFDPAAANRIVLCTDGDFNVGVSSDDELVRMIEQQRQTGVFLSIFGFGMGNLKDSKLEGLADKGNGHYAYIDDLDEARKVFIEELTGTLYTIAKDVKLQVEFNPARVAAYRLLGYENRLLQAEDFNNDRVDAGDLGAGHSVTALYEIVPADRPVPEAAPIQPVVDPLRYQAVANGRASGQESEARAAPDARPESNSRQDNPLPATPDGLHPTELLTVKLRYKQPADEVSVKREFTLQDEPQACSQELQFAAAVTGYGLLLRNSQYAAGCNWDLVIELAEGAKGDDATGRRGEFIELARQARRLSQAYERLRMANARLPEMTSIHSGIVSEQARSDSPAVVQIDSANRLVWINRGALDDVRPRMTFHVLAGSADNDSPVKANAPATANRKATLEVMDVVRQSARCRVIAADETQLIAVGDGIESDQWPPRVLEVAGGRFGVISVGANQGVRDGIVYQVIRLNPATPEQRSGPQVIGEMRIIDVQTDDCIGQFVPASNDTALAVGDRVTPRSPVVRGQ